MTKFYPKFLTVIFLIFFLLALDFVFPPEPVFAWTNLDGGDHGGTSWSPANGTYISGTHTNIDTFTVAAGTTVYIQPYNGASYGSVIIYAKTIDIQGTLTAARAGFRGGSGGSGGVGDNAACDFGGDHINGRPGVNGSGSFGGVGGAGGGRVGECRWPGYGAAGSVGNRGGYAAVGINGDNSTDESLFMGSGGGGGGGGGASIGINCWWGGSGGGGGGAGNHGGGYVKLYAIQNITISGNILTIGGSSSTGNGGKGGDAQVLISCYSPISDGGTGGDADSSGASSGGAGGKGSSYVHDGGVGASGAAGAGGGVLLKSDTVNVSGSINALGGGSVSDNGGTIKIFSAASSTTGALSYGRLYSSSTPPNAPSNLTATAISQSQIDLSWTDNSGAETGFKIERSLTSGSGFSQIATTTANTTSYSDTDLNPNTDYYYRVRAYNAAGDSAYSNEASAQTQLGTALEASLISSVFDTFVSNGAAINSLMWQGSKPSGAEVRFQLASAATSTGPWNYKGWDGSESSYYTPTDANAPIQINPRFHNNHRYFRYKIFLYTDQARAQSPLVDDVIINWSP